MALSKDEIVQAISEMSLLDVSELVKMLEEKFGVTAAAPVMMGGSFAGAPAAAAVEEEEQTEFDVILESYGDQKLQVLKVLRELTGMGLKEAKELVDNVPKPIKEKTNKEEAQNIKQKIEAAGAKVNIK